jgi:hypothetical protein
VTDANQEAQRYRTELRDTQAQVAQLAPLAEQTPVLMRRVVVAELGLNPELAAHLVGNTEAELRAHAQTLQGLFGSGQVPATPAPGAPAPAPTGAPAAPTPPAPAPAAPATWPANAPQGPQSPAPAPKSLLQQAAEAEAAGDKKLAFRLKAQQAAQGQQGA